MPSPQQEGSGLIPENMDTALDVHGLNGLYQETMLMKSLIKGT